MKYISDKYLGDISYLKDKDGLNIKIEDINKLPGIYMILNKINNNKYIGSAKILREREYEHLWDLKNDKHHSNYLQNTYNKYGKENFEFIILEIIIDIKQLIIREQYYLDTLNPEYNICKFAGSALGRKHSDETKRKIGDSNRGRRLTEEQIKTNRYAQLNVSEEIKIKRSNNMRVLGERYKGVPKTEEHKRKISESNMGRIISYETREKIRKSRLGTKHTDEHKKKISESNIGRIVSNETKRKISINQPARKKILQFDLNNNFIRSFDSISDAAKELRTHRTCIVRNLRGKVKRLRDWVFKYAQE